MQTILLIIAIGVAFLIGYAVVFCKIANISIQYTHDIVFLRRMASIRKHISWATKECSFDKLEDALHRLTIENNYIHNEYERDIISECVKMVTEARESIIKTLIEETANN